MSRPAMAAIHPLSNLEELSELIINPIFRDRAYLPDNYRGASPLRVSRGFTPLSEKPDFLLMLK